MDEIGFRNWLAESGKNAKVISDTISRLKRLERELGPIDIDSEYKKDQCNQMLSLFENTGRNEKMAHYKTSLPIGKYHMNTFRYALNMYISYLERKSSE